MNGMSPKTAFRVLPFLLGAFLAASAAPSPLYSVYQDEWGFSDITLTSVFAVYALTLLATLLVVGSLSDRVGRKPVAAAGLVLEIVTMVLFLVADSSAWLFAARGLQGIATGLVIAAVSAAVIDLEPPGRDGLGALVNTCAPIGGLSVGAIAAGVLVQYGPDATRFVYALLAVVFVVALLLLRLVPETVRETGDWRDALRIQIGLPEGSKRAFLSCLPALAATWSLGGFYLSLGPSLVAEILGDHSHLTGAAVITVLTASGFVAVILVRDWDPFTMLSFGLAAFAVGVAAAVIALAIPSTLLFFAATVLAGIGFGPGFLGVLRHLIPLAPPDGRAELVSSIYVASYLSFSVPAIAAGVAVEIVGLHTTADVYGGLSVVLALMAGGATTYERRTIAAQ
jgi:predicted MFS family arabinose efflux permease